MTPYRTVSNTLAVLLVLAMAEGQIRAESWFSPQPRIFAAPAGQFALKVIPDKKMKGDQLATGTYFSLDEKGKESIRWTKKLVNVPHQVLVSDHAYIATIDTWAGLGRQHALVLYAWRDGKAVVDYPLEKLLTFEEIDNHAKNLGYSRQWAHAAEFAWKQIGFTTQFAVRFQWGKQIVFELTERADKTVEVKVTTSYAK